MPKSALVRGDERQNLEIKHFIKNCHPLTNSKASLIKWETSSDSGQWGWTARSPYLISLGLLETQALCPSLSSPGCAHFLSPLEVTTAKPDRCIPFHSLLALTEQAGAINRYYCKPHPLLCALGSGTDPHKKPHKKKKCGLLCQEQQFYN